MDSASSSKTSTRSTAKRTLEGIVTIIQTNNDNSDEASYCTICLDTLTSTGSHKPVCLKCGYIFGENCLIRWIKTENDSGSSRCSTCNTKASLKDIRVLYTKNVTVDNTAEITAVERKLIEANHAKHLMEMEAERWKSNAKTLDIEVKRLKRLRYDGHTEPAACQRTFTVCKNQSCRVMAYNTNNRMLVMSHQPDTTTLDSYEIRKMDFVVVLVVGGQMGSVYYIDRKFMKVFNSEQIQKLGCVSLNLLPPSPSRSFMSGGFLKTKMDHLSVLEETLDNDYYTYKETELPLTGLWSSTSYDCQSNLVLTSARPYGPFKTSRHIVSKFADFDEEGPILTQVVTFYAGDKSTQLYRPCLVPSSGGYNDDSLVCCYDEGSGTIKVFNVNKKKNVNDFKVTDNILDLCPLPGITIQGRRIVAGLSKNSVSIFSV
ncbi:uncharacterized protein LOC114130657 [Aphis gossypii]|uniref:uncharacterized protein LOC114130657 n=1 Tax=Aphis gossypii TaxID=80765 RepID=UPI002158B8BB|nr:uncharacterized protein LOC114130657 [Aphis gossypii]